MADHAPLTLICQFFVEAETIFNAWTEPNLMRLWLFKSPTNQILSIHSKLKIGERFSILELNNDEKIDHFGEYLEIKRPHKLLFTLEVPWHFPGISKVSVNIENRPNGCEMIFTQSGIDTSLTKKSWEKMFENLNSLIAGDGSMLHP